jgi:hypothetical protein
VTNAEVSIFKMLHLLQYQHLTVLCACPCPGSSQAMAVAKLFLQFRSTMMHFCTTMETYLMTDVVDSECPLLMLSGGCL